MLKRLILAALLCAAPANAALFGTAEYRRDGGEPLMKWQAMMHRAPAPGCTPVRVADAQPFPDVAPSAGTPVLAVLTDCSHPKLDAAKVVAAALHEAPAARLATVNSAVNQLPYIEDRVNYGVDDYWAAPDEFFARGGDCEDFAIAKYVLLRRAGVPAESMRVVIVRDMALSTAHAILAVTVSGKTFILDNQDASVRPASAVAWRYQPVYSINETGWWLHMPA